MAAGRVVGKAWVNYMQSNQPSICHRQAIDTMLAALMLSVKFSCFVNVSSDNSGNELMPLATAENHVYHRQYFHIYTSHHQELR